MTSTGNELLAAVLASPDDDNVRLVYADWLQENGQGDRAEFIRVQLRLAKMPRPLEVKKLYASVNVPNELLEDASFDFMGRPVRWAEKTIRERHWELLATRERELWSAAVESKEAFKWFPGTNCYLSNTNSPPTFWLNRGSGKGDLITRGFLHSVTCSAEDWFKHADALLASHPVREVTLTTWPDSAGGVADQRRWHTTRLEATYPGVTFHFPPEPYTFGRVDVTNYTLATVPLTGFLPAPHST